MANTRDDYRREMEQKYLKYIQSNDPDVRKQIKKASVRASARMGPSGGSLKGLVGPMESLHVARPRATHTQTQAQKSDTGNMGEMLRFDRPLAATVGRYLESGLRVSTLIIDSTFRDTEIYPEANNFIVKLAEPLRDVAGIRLLRTEFYQPSNNVGYFVMNEIQIPLQLYNIESGYIYLNGYNSVEIANEMNTTFFGRIGPGTEVYPAITGDIRQDPLLYTFMPAEEKLRRFHFKLLKGDGSTYQVNNARIVLTLAVYCLAPGVGVPAKLT
jgi:hypothetical protein